MEREILKVIKVCETALLPSYQTDGSAGADLHACIEEDVVLKPGRRVLVRTGISIELPEGFEAQVRSRSGLALKNGVVVLNSPGTIDTDYRGEIKVILANFGEEDFVITSDMRIAQIVIARFEQFEFVAVQSLSGTLRGGGGFGSTGI
jgi:dUTP pyrophosphatase